ncbi:Uncharacterised protein [Neisseria meningitidis]|nr:Uncharacterised protein [Neisseria meningitidis]
METGYDNDFTGGQIGTHFFVVDVFDAGFGVGSVGLEGDLPAGVALGINADVFQSHGQQTDGHLFAGSENDVEFARIGMLLHFVRQCDQSVGFTAHGGYDDYDVVSFGAGFGDTFGYVFDAFGRAY